jgi:hypothetical protein
MPTLNKWLGRQDVNRTFEDDVECDVAEIQAILEEADSDVDD